MITRGTTPSIRFSFNQINVSLISVIYLTIEQGSLVIEKDISTATVDPTHKFVEWAFTQEETLQFDEKMPVKVQIRYRLQDGKAYASKIFTVSPYDILKDGVI